MCTINDIPNELIAQIALIDNNSKWLCRNILVMLMLTCKRFYAAICGNYLCKERMGILNMRNHINKDIASIVECAPPHCTKIKGGDYLTLYDLSVFDKLEIIRWTFPDKNSAFYKSIMEITEKILCDYGYYSADYYTIIKFVS
jgi:hypothetical protein